MSTLHTRLAHRVLDHIRAEGWRAGHHLTEQSLEAVLQISRSPVRGALAVLARQGVVTPRPPRRGLFLAVDAAALAQDGEGAPHEDQDYLQFARDRLAGALGSVLAEADAMRRYGWTRERTRRVLARAAEEGWMEQRAGKGWTFLPMIDGAASCAESYALRLAVEPAALRMPGFRADAAVLARLRRQQEALAAGAYRTAGRVELFQANALFHEALARLSGNRFVAQLVVRQNGLRRLLEYRMSEDRARVGRQCEEHVGILVQLERNDTAAASRLLAAHLEAAGAAKVRQLEETP